MARPSADELRRVELQARLAARLREHERRAIIEWHYGPRKTTTHTPNTTHRETGK